MTDIQIKDLALELTKVAIKSGKILVYPGCNGTDETSKFFNRAVSDLIEKRNNN